MPAQFLKYWVPPIVWVVLIYWGSGDVLSEQHTSRFIGPLLAWLFPHTSAEVLERIHFGIRKASHVIEYALLAFLVLRAVLHGTRLKWARSRLLVMVWIVCVLVAAGDEVRQSFVASRGASPWDVVLDGAGAGIALWICGCSLRRRERRGDIADRLRDDCG